MKPIETFVRQGMRLVAKDLDRTTNGAIHPNHITWIGLVLHLPIAYLIVQESYVAAGLFLIFFGLLDTVDGELARIQKRESDQGIVLDAVTDRLKEVIILAAVALAIGQVSVWAPFWITLAVGGSLLGSFVRTRGEVQLAQRKTTLSGPELNRLNRGGLAPYPVRVVIMAIGLLTDQLLVAVILIAILSIITAMTRLFAIQRQLS